ncbi:hypothetical protein [Nitrincola sp. A-D6]|uniref:hypothetical protein n=1 Tax=Nitrincola sp. A-D6 TaxID=1545442 RepID=UPI00055DF8B4|nr:hypothetical protein [Nitrincola sp. A-D6]
MSKKGFKQVLKLVKKLGHVTVYFSPEWEEYMVVINNAEDDRATYHTDDREDALGTAQSMNDIEAQKLLNLFLFPNL